MPTEKRARQKAARREKLEAQRKSEKRRQLTRRVVIVVVLAAVVITSVALIVNSGNKSASSTTTSTTTHGPQPLTQSQTNVAAVAAGCPQSPTQTVNTLHWSSPPPMTINVNAAYYAHILTTQGPIVVKLEPNLAPKTVNNFVFLAKNGFYKCVTFHRVIPDFVIQGGDPTGTGSGGPGYKFADELPKAGNPTYPLYSVAMANSGPNTNGSQFFIITGTSGEQLQPNYSLFGQVVSGIQAVKFINVEGSNQNNGQPPQVINRMLSVTITSKA